MLTLYDFGNSVCCQKVRITMRAKGLDWESVNVDLFKAEQYDQNYLKLNPRGMVPTLVHDGKAVIESTLICEYLDDTFPGPPLKPADPWLRARMRLWSKMVDEGLFEGVTELSFSAMFRERMRSMPEEIRQRRFRNVGDPRRRDRFMSTYEFGMQSPFVVHGIAAYERAFKMLEDALAEGGAVDRWRECEPRGHQPDALCGAAELPRIARSLDKGPTSCARLVEHGPRMAELQGRFTQSDLGSRVCRDANARPEDCGRRRQDHR